MIFEADFAAMVPAILAVSKTFPLGDFSPKRARNAFLDILIFAEARAMRSVTLFALTSTIPL